MVKMIYFAFTINANITFNGDDFYLEPNMRLKMRVVLMNAAGLYEAGIDGGGLFREFNNEVLKAAFDPNRGFFRLTRDQQLYPNPSVEQIHENYVPHYFFIGRMLGKVRSTSIA